MLKPNPDKDIFDEEVVLGSITGENGELVQF